MAPIALKAPFWVRIIIVVRHFIQIPLWTSIDSQDGSSLSKVVGDGCEFYIRILLNCDFGIIIKLGAALVRQGNG